MCTLLERADILPRRVRCSFCDKNLDPSTDAGAAWDSRTAFNAVVCCRPCALYALPHLIKDALSYPREKGGA